jgi:hypothetical protein
MRTHRRWLFAFFYRSFFIPALVISSAVLMGELSPAVFTSSSVLAKADDMLKKETTTHHESTAAYHWNLTDGNLPLITMPDHIAGGVDFSITYSMDQFEFPLFQSLYYNERIGKYILMVMPKDGRRAEFINLSPLEEWAPVETNGNSTLHLVDKGYAKQISTRDGTVYIFTSFIDGELHCSQIRDRDGLVISLKYTNQAAIDSIADSSGRTISFSYTNYYVSSITQTWGPGLAKMKKTWAIADSLLPTIQAATLVPVGLEISKHIPSNALRPNYTEEMAASDWMLASIFGEPNAVAAANGFEPVGLGSQYPLYRGDWIGDDGRIRRGHLSCAMHLYGSLDGWAESGIYVPVGFISHSNEPTPVDAAVTFYYPRLGNHTDITLAVFHVANFHLSSEDGRVRIGDIGGPGGSAASYKHAHLEFYRGDTGLPAVTSRDTLRIDPVTVFEPKPATTIE